MRTDYTYNFGCECRTCPTLRDDKPIPDDLVLYVTPNSLTSCTRNPRRYPPKTVRIPPLFVMCDTNAEMLALTQ